MEPQKSLINNVKSPRGDENSYHEVLFIYDVYSFPCLRSLSNIDYKIRLEDHQPVSTTRLQYKIAKKLTHYRFLFD